MPQLKKLAKYSCILYFHLRAKSFQYAQICLAELLKPIPTALLTG